MGINAAIRTVLLSVLDDDEGVSSDTYNALLELGQYLPDYGTPIFDRIEATDGRFYLPEGAKEILALCYGGN